ncbi:phosphatase [Cytobacillus firmus]|uniref:Phosphatase n=1 Tax=Cytobacillus firmus TaxID=1399 RepID=A0AA46SIP6_CYTFI|nr:phosphatase [Cytobacillus firmus]MBY6051236.1 phosphatase [Cytobacillus firmus]MCU1805603.1 phosphatase [Cytobacillus firmus]USK37897.1 phosphatase [Cytobacillus firmus]UYG94584.1 phosphatase [Cytobacillus firmus]
MWRRNEGFFLAELLLSLSGLLLAAGIIFPLVIKALVHSEEVKQDYESTQLLYESLMEAASEGNFPEGKTIKKNQTVYQIFLKENQVFMEVCIRYENVRDNTKEKCEVFQ